MIQFGRFQLARHTTSGSRAILKGSGVMWLMYSSMTTLMNWAMTMFRAVWNTRSSFQSACSSSSLPARRLCSRSSNVLIMEVKAVEFTRSPPTAKMVSRLT